MPLGSKQLSSSLKVRAATGRDSAGGGSADKQTQAPSVATYSQTKPFPVERSCKTQTTTKSILWLAG